MPFAFHGVLSPARSSPSAGPPRHAACAPAAAPGRRARDLQRRKQCVRRVNYSCSFDPCPRGTHRRVRYHSGRRRMRAVGSVSPCTQLSPRVRYGEPSDELLVCRDARPPQDFIRWSSCLLRPRIRGQFGRSNQRRSAPATPRAHSREQSRSKHPFDLIQYSAALASTICRAVLQWKPHARALRMMDSTAASTRER